MTFDGSLGDASGNGFSGEMIGRDGEEAPAPVFVEGRFGRALSLDGNTAVRVPLDLHHDRYPQVTITGWVYRENDDSGGDLVATGRGEGPRIVLSKANLFADHPGGRNQANKAIRPGHWSFFAGTWDFQTGFVRLNWRARSAEKRFDVGDLSPPAQDLWIGSRSDGGGFAAGLRIDDVRIYGRALTDEELEGLSLGPSTQEVAEPATGTAGERESSEAGATARQPGQPEYDGDVVDLPSGAGAGADGRDSATLDDPLAGSGDLTADADAHSAEQRGVDVDAMRHTVVIDGSTRPGRTRYTLTASGPIEKAEGDVDGFRATINDDDVVDGRTASGIVGTAVDAYYVYGGVEEVALEDPAAAAVYVDGELMDEDTGLRAYLTEREPEPQALALPEAPFRYGDEIYRFGGVSGTEGNYDTTITFFEQQALLQDISIAEVNNKPCLISIHGAALVGGSAYAQIDNCEQGPPSLTLFAEAGSSTMEDGFDRPDPSQAIVALQVCTSNPISGSPLSTRFQHWRVKGIRVKRSRVNDDGTIGTAEVMENLLERTNCADWRDESSCPTPSVATGMRLYFTEGTTAAPRDYLSGVQLLCSQLEPNE